MSRSTSTGEPVLSRQFGGGDIAALRRAVAGHAELAGLDERRSDDLILVVDEILTNAVRHGGGTGLVEIWVSAGRVTFRVVDDGPGMDASLTPRPPAPTQGGGRGLWIAHQLTDEITISSGPEGTAVAGVISTVV
jgi:serine/threonine-protein kinase RsbW